MDEAVWAIAVFDIDGVVRDVSGSYRRALADTVEAFTQGAYRPTQADIDRLKAEGIWNNDWEASQEFIYRHAEAHGQRRATQPDDPDPNALWLDFEALVAFFQARYRGPDPDHWTGYICQEPLLMQAEYVAQLTAAGVAVGFFSGATTGSARYVLETRMGLVDPVLIAMEDAPGKPDPTGLFATLDRLPLNPDGLPVIYAGDTVADMKTIGAAQTQQCDRPWFAVGVLPPHVQQDAAQQAAYAANLQQAGAAIVVPHVHELTSDRIRTLVQNSQ